VLRGEEERVQENEHHDDVFDALLVLEVEGLHISAELEAAIGRLAEGGEALLLVLALATCFVGGSLDDIHLIRGLRLVVVVTYLLNVIEIFLVRVLLSHGLLPLLEL
jgi:hypothetical protein